MFWSQRPPIIDKTLGVQASYPEANFGGNQILDPLDEKGTKAKLVGGGKKRESFPGHDASMACVWWQCEDGCGERGAVRIVCRERDGYGHGGAARCYLRNGCLRVYMK